MPTKKPKHPLPQLSCFVACGFGHKDVDRFFDRIVIPVLTKANVKAVRVDRVEHNGNIDDQIEAQLREADLVLADLTYARPSVYLEAGVAEGMRTPVIFTARSDHFKERDSDPNGNLRVHFDLKMRNIVAWPEVGPVMLARKKLAKRVAHVLKPILRQRIVDSRAAVARQEFAKLSPQGRGEQMSKVATQLLSKRKFRDAKGKATEGWSRGGIAVRSSAGRHRAEIIVVQSETWPQRKLSILGSDHIGLANRPRQWSGKRCAVHVICVSMRSVGAQVLDRSLPHFEPLLSDGIQIRRYSGDRELRTLTLIDRVDSLLDFEQRLDRALSVVLSMPAR